MSRLPTIGVSACTKTIGRNLHHFVGDDHLRAALGEALIVPRFLRQPGSLPLSGSASAVELHHYSRKTGAAASLHDSARDAGVPLERSNLACAGQGAACLASRVAALAPARSLGTVAAEGAKIRTSNYPAIFQAFGEACRGRAGQR